MCSTTCVESESVTTSDTPWMAPLGVAAAGLTAALAVFTLANDAASLPRVSFSAESPLGSLLSASSAPEAAAGTRSGWLRHVQPVLPDEPVRPAAQQGPACRLPSPGLQGRPRHAVATPALTQPE